MRTNKIVIYSIIYLFLLSACNKEEERTRIMAGITNSDMLYYEYNPPLELKLQPDLSGEIKFGIDSIDIDLDGDYDIVIRQRMHTNSELMYYDYENDNFPYIGLLLKNDFEVAYKNVSVILGQGAFSSIRLVDALYYENRIDKIENWDNSKKNLYAEFQNGQIWLWGDPPTPWFSTGPWFRLNNIEVYIGIRQKTETEYKFGWIKLKVSTRNKFEAISYAIEN